ncbi:LuxR C-terminal-related transcriptional regulator [Roseateles asaccharophilus]|uniref:DNA-binding NarL/FixJ family response regulator n=1 Tax=Roseateles asaccharophilus TaxID=582607 RepID=A0ABU2AB22_9BURK|nr:LuxR C-terminal-related transcriptional regulator [Roseateles asaccharophilus]MDR7334394.1 DNA-binding NarL/FixJ family response regulator [Roseateles asaccharophilus]
MNMPRDIPDAEAAAASLELGGHSLRIVCVDERLPDHAATPGSSRLRQCYLPDEIVHFEWAGHRYAVVPDSVAAPSPRAAAELHTLLTNRELQIVQLICNGLLTKQVSARLHISEFTVRSYLKTIYCKLGVRSRGAMVYTYAQSLSRGAKVDATDTSEARQVISVMTKDRN